MAAPMVAKAAVKLAQSKTGRRIIAGVVIFLLVLIASPVLVIGAAVGMTTDSPHIPNGGKPPEGLPPAKGGWQRPTTGPITTYWLGYPGHQAIDIAPACGTAIVAAKSGTVTFNAWGGNYGNFTIIDHGGGYVTRYAHQIRLGDVQVGQKVTIGQVIGHVGTTGNSTGCHLHFEVQIHGVLVNPIPTYLNG